jgi:non-heme chloroperoxidase
VAAGASPFASYACVDTWLTDLIDDVRLVSVEGGPHNIGWTHPDEVNEVLLQLVASR